MKLNYDRLESLIKESGKSKAYLCAKVNRGRYYMRDLKNANTNVQKKPSKFGLMSWGLHQST